jgi:hypothetical protein
MTRLVATIAPALSISLVLIGCQPKDDTTAGAEFSTGVPRASTVLMSVPGSDSRAVTVESSTHALLGETAEWYKRTRDVTVSVNAGALAVGALVKLVTDYPPTTVSADSAVWGPWKGPLDPVEWKVTVTRIAPHEYQYTFEGRDKHDQVAAFVTVLSGTHTAGVDAQGMEMEGFGAGTFVLDWDARASLPQPDGNIGTVTYTYSHVGPAAVVNIAAAFKQVKDDNQPGKRIDVNYAFVQNPGAEGSMDFVYNVPADSNSAGGLGKVKSRWLWSGAGRSDVSLVPTNLNLTYTVSECWDVSYLSVYKSTPLSTKADDNYGKQSDCAFPTVMYSDL